MKPLDALIVAVAVLAALAFMAAAQPTSPDPSALCEETCPC